MAELLYQASAEVCSTVGLISFVGQYILISVQDSEYGSPLLTAHRILADTPIMFDVMTRRLLKTDQEKSRKGKEIMIYIHMCSSMSY